MSDWPVGLSTGCFYQDSIFDCLETISRGGFNIVEVCSFPAHLNYHDTDTVARASRRVEELGMEAYSFHAPFSDSIDISSSDASLREQALVEILQAAEAAAMFQVRYFVIHPGPEHWDLKEEERRLDRLKWAAEILNRVAERCKELGRGCILENKLPHLLFARTSDILWILSTMDTGEMGVCLDTGHANLSGDIYSVMHKLGWRLRMSTVLQALSACYALHAVSKRCTLCQIVDRLARRRIPIDSILVDRMATLASLYTALSRKMIL